MKNVFSDLGINQVFWSPRKILDVERTNFAGQTEVWGKTHFFLRKDYIIHSINICKYAKLFLEEIRSPGTDYHFFLLSTACTTFIILKK